MRKARDMVYSKRTTNNNKPGKHQTPHLSPQVETCACKHPGVHHFTLWQSDCKTQKLNSRPNKSASVTSQKSCGNLIQSYMCDLRLSPPTTASTPS